MVDVDERARELQREYLREWRKRNKEKMRVYREKYWLKKAYQEEGREENATISKDS